MFGRFKEDQTVEVRVNGYFYWGVLERPADYDRHEWIVSIHGEQNRLVRVSRSSITRTK